MVGEPKEQNINRDYQEYRETGGMLDEHHYGKAMSVLEELTIGNIPEVKDSSLVQAIEMARVSKVPFTLEQEYLYAALRSTAGEDDQQLMAEVLRLTDNTKLELFMSAYPNIWKP